MSEPDGLPLPRRPAGPSLAERAGGALRTLGQPARIARLSPEPAASPVRRGGRKEGILLAALLAAGPLATLAGAQWLTARTDAEAARLARQAAPVARAAEAEEAARDVLRAAVARPGPAAMLERMARVLPAEDRLTLLRRDANGVLRLEVATTDPDRLRASLREQGGRWREEGQAQGDAALLVRYREGAR